MTDVIDVSAWQPSEVPEEWMGTRAKVWLKEPDTGTPWLFKAVRCKELPDGRVRCFGEDWAEWAAAQAAGHLDLPVATVRLADRAGRWGVVSRSVLRDDRGEVVADFLEHGNELLQARHSTYAKDQWREAAGYTLDAVWASLEGIGVPEACAPPITTAFDLFAGMLVLDALLASTDRHHENWAALARGRHRWFAPIFDLGTCLGFQESDENRERYLTGASGHGVDTWVLRGRSNHFEGRPGLVALALDGLARVEPEVARYWIARVEAFDLEWWRATLAHVPSARMSHLARMFAFDVVRLNRERLLDGYGTRP